MKSVEGDYYSSYYSGENYLIMNPGDMYVSDAELLRSNKGYESEERKSQRSNSHGVSNDLSFWSVIKRMRFGIKESSRKVD